MRNPDIIEDYVAMEREALAAGDVATLLDLDIRKRGWSVEEALAYSLMTQSTATPEKPQQRRPGPRPRDETLIALGYALRCRDEGDSQQAAAEQAADRFNASVDTILKQLKKHERET